MALRINTNVAAINAHRNLLGTERSMGKNMERLSSGYRINHASDDAAGLSIANRMRTNVRSLTVASRNVTEGRAMMQVAEGAANQIEGILERLKELATQAASDNAATDRGKIDTEAQTLLTEINRIADDTEYQGTKLITGTFGSYLDSASSSATLGANGLDFSGINVSNATAEQWDITHANDTITLTGAVSTDAQTISGADLSDGVQTLDFSDLGIKLTTNGAFTADGSAGLSLDGLQFTVAGGSGKFQVGSGDTSSEDQIGVALGDLTTGASGLSLTLDLNSRDTAVTALTSIDTAIDTINTKLGDMGAAMNRFDYAYSNIQVSMENFSASESVIRDVDMAAEMVGFTKNQIMLQAGTAMLAQANMSSQGVLSLIG